MDVWGTEQGYVIPKDKYYLPEIEFEPGELVALLVAAQSGGQDTAAESGARKLLYGADGGVLAGLGGGPLASGSDARSNLVHAAAEAAQELRRVRFRYRTSQGKTGERDVDAWAMVFRAGHWYLVGHDRERDDVRAFRLSRMAGEITDAGAGTAPPGGVPSGRPCGRRSRGSRRGTTARWCSSRRDGAWFAASQFPGAREIGTESRRMGGDGGPDGGRGCLRGDAARIRTGCRRPVCRPRCATPSCRGWRRSLPERQTGRCRRPRTASGGCSRSSRTSCSTRARRWKRWRARSTCSASTAPARPRPPVHVGPAAIRPGRPDRRRRRRGRAHLDLDGRSFLAPPAAHEDRGARGLPARNGAPRHARDAGCARAREGAREAPPLPRRRDAQETDGRIEIGARWPRPGASRRAPRGRDGRTNGCRSSISPHRPVSGAVARSRPKRCSRGMGHWYVAAWDV